MKPRVLRNWIWLVPLAAVLWALLLSPLWGQTDEVAVGVGWQAADGNGVQWTEVPYPPTNGSMFFVDQDGGNDAWDGRSPFRYSFSGATYTHSTRRLVANGAFSSYTHTGGDYTDVIDLDGIGQVVIESKVDNDTVVIEATSLLTGDLGSVASDSGPKATPTAGNALCSDGVGNHLLFQCGDEWTITSDLELKSGASASEPQVYSAFDTGARPKLIADSCNCWRNVGALSDVYVIGLYLQADKEITEDYTGIDIASATDASGGYLFENTVVDGFSTNVQISAQTGQELQNWTMRNCHIINSKDGTPNHSQGIYGTRFRGVLVEGNIFHHNGYTDDWQDTAILASGTTPAFTNGDTLTLTMVRYGAYTARDEGDNVELVLIDTNDSSGGVDSVSIVDEGNGDNIEVRLDLTMGVPSNVVAAAIQAYNGGADFVCTSSGTSNLVLADAGQLDNVTSGGYSYNPTVFNHHIYFSYDGEDVTFRENVFGESCHMAMKLNTHAGTIIQHDNLMTRCDRWGHIGNSRYEVGEGSYCYIYNNCCVESRANANPNSNGPTIKNTLGGYFRSNFIGNRPISEGTGGNALKVSGVTDELGGDYAGTNNTTIADNVFWNFRAPVTIEIGPDAGDGGRTSTGNAWQDNIVGNTSDDDRPLLETELTDSGEMAYSGTNYWSTQDTATAWLEAEGSPLSTSSWQSSYEATAAFTNPTSNFTDHTRTATTFAVSVGYADWDAWMAALLGQSKSNWNPAIHAAAVNNHILAGLDIGDFDPSPDETAPQFVSAELTGANVLTINFDESVTATDETGFSLVASGGAATLTMTDFSGTSLAFTTSRTIYTGESLTLSYDSGTGDVADAADNALGDLTSESVTNSGSESPSATPGNSIIPGIYVR